MKKDELKQELEELRAELLRREKSNVERNKAIRIAQKRVEAIQMLLTPTDATECGEPLSRPDCLQRLVAAYLGIRHEQVEMSVTRKAGYSPVVRLRVTV